jgi:hypothetical protein
MSAADLARWHDVLVDGLNQSNIFSEVVKANGEHVPDTASYVIDGRITRYSFRKNWVPTFFPFHLGLSFITLTGYTWLAGPTTVTMVEFETVVDLKDSKTGATIKNFRVPYKDTSTLNVYSKDTNNPYGNPNLVFSQVISTMANEIAAALP